MDPSENALRKFDLEIPAEAFRLSYNVYIVSIAADGVERHFYVGQTGDRNYPVARSIFGRLGGHFGYRKSSTENQVYRGVATKILGMQLDSIDQEKVFEFLSRCRVVTRTFRISDYSSASSRDHHRGLVRQAEAIEAELLNFFSETYGRDVLLNSKMPKRFDLSTFELGFQEKVGAALSNAATF